MAPFDWKPFESRASHECIIKKLMSLKQNYPCFTNDNDAEFMQ
jgi:hypothetical protein